MSVSFRGVSAGQDARFGNKEARLMRAMKFPKELELKVDCKKARGRGRVGRRALQVGKAVCGGGGRSVTSGRREGTAAAC